MSKKALIIGIDEYLNYHDLNGCSHDAEKICSVLKRNEDNSPNFECRTLTTSGKIKVTREVLLDNIARLFSSQDEAILFYFSGHGSINQMGGYLATYDSNSYTPGVSMLDVLSIARSSKAREIIIILDCCYAGAFGEHPISNDFALLREGMSILSACRSNQYAVMNDGTSLLTSLIYEALNGGASDITGNVTLASIYAYVDKILGAWDQRPVIKLNISNLISLRKCKPQIDLDILRKLSDYFITSDYEYSLDPSYEPEAEPHNPKHEEIFGHLQEFRALNLVTPSKGKHMFYEAISGGSCKLTPLGKFYWQLVKGDRI